MSQLCDETFNTRICYIGSLLLEIDEYEKKYVSKNKSRKLECINDHELIYVKGQTPYFRHKNSEDVIGSTMTEWHKNWQSNFETKEKKFNKLDGQYKARRADVVLEDYKIVIEIQHSYINKQTVENRCHDYSLHGYKIIWIINGDKSVNVSNVNGKINLVFLTDDWKYKSFIKSYDIIYIDIENTIYKINPKQVKNYMITVSESYTMVDFITMLKSNNDRLHSLFDTKQCTLYIKQQGAGNGKTFGLIQKLQDSDFEHYRCIIIVSKQHSAKKIIKDEFNQQIKNGHLTKLEIIKDYYEESKKDNIDSKKPPSYVIEYRNIKTDITTKMIICTMDSLMYNLGNKYAQGIDKFKEIVNSIISNYLEKEDINSVKLAGNSYDLNKHMCLISDETQDLYTDYGDAIIKIMQQRYIDAYIVGDKLQSISNENNAFTHLLKHDFANIHTIIGPRINICRRFYNRELVKFVNCIIPFDKHQLDEIQPWKNEKVNDKSLFLECLPSGESKYDNTKQIEFIMKHYEKEVKNYNLKPSDFLIVTPVIKGNKIFNSLQLAINRFWKEQYDKNGQSEMYDRYAIIHRSEEGTSINLDESDNATRMVSIHAAKGDGRKIVFVVELTEKNLNCFGKTDSLVYNSLVHVALTRMKERLYIFYESCTDDIGRRLHKYTKQDIKPVIRSTSVRYNSLYKALSSEDFIQIQTNIIDKGKNIAINDNETQIIDMGHHTIRYMCYQMLFYLAVARHDAKNEDVKLQYYAILMKIKITANVPKVTNNWKEFITNTWKNINNVEKYICLIKETDKGADHIQYHNILEYYISHVHKKIKTILNTSYVLCPMECLILHYMVQICTNGMYTDFTLNDLYYIVHIYAITYEIGSHKDIHTCMCDELFTKYKPIHDYKKDTKMATYLKKHYNQTIQSYELFQSFINKHPYLNYLINYGYEFPGENKNHIIRNRFNHIAYDEKNVYLIYIKPQFNELNRNEIIFQSIFDTFLINYIKKTDKDDDSSTKFAGKRVHTVIFAVDQKDYFEFNWYDGDGKNIIKRNKLLLKEIIKKNLINLYESYKTNVYEFIHFYTKKFLIEKKKIENIIQLIQDIYTTELKARLSTYSAGKQKEHNENIKWIDIIFVQVQTDIRRSKNKEKVLIDYINEPEKIKELCDIEIEHSINSYLGL